jgi:hypothetical protein
VPLDWGLGHATRCIPIIMYLLHIGCEVIAGAEGAQKALLAKEFPELKIIDINGYRLKYGHSGWQTRWKIVSQSAQILTKIKYENKWLDQFLDEQQVDLIISDNRYGLYSKKVHSIFITHQLAIRTGLGPLADRLIQRLNYRLIEKFSACWVPDEEGENNLAGELSHPQKPPKIPITYIGLLSRFSKWARVDNTLGHSLDLKSKFKLLIILSGPEPQRSIFEMILINELKHYQGPVTFLRGLPGESDQFIPFNRVSFYNHLSAEFLYGKISEADIIISRSGYSTVMDMVMLGKKCVFVATPGQTEQEYLSSDLMKKNMCVAVDQDKFSLNSAIEQAQKVKTPAILYNVNQYQSAIDALSQLH